MPPLFGKVVIVGPGLMGGSLGLFLRSARLAGEVVGVARRQSTLDAALSVGAIDWGDTRLPAALVGADLVVVATPAGAIGPAMREMAPCLRPPFLVTDLGSTKAQVVREAEAALPPEIDFVGGHPMVGSEESGPRAARADLYRGALWVLTPTNRSRPQAVARLRGLVADLGARPLEIDPETHDRAVAASSHLPHVVASVLAAAAGRLALETPAVTDLSARGFRDTTRVAAGPADVWRDICLTNREALLDAIQVFRDHLDALAAAIQAADGPAIEARLRDAATARARLLR